MLLQRVKLVVQYCILICAGHNNFLRHVLETNAAHAYYHDAVNIGLRMRY